MPKEVLTRVGKNKNIQLFYFFRSNDDLGLNIKKTAFLLLLLLSLFKRIVSLV